MTTPTSRRSFFGTLVAALFGAPAIAQAALTRKLCETTREECLVLVRQQAEANPGATCTRLNWMADSGRFVSYSVCMLPKGVSTAEVIAKADPTVGYPVMFDVQDHSGEFYITRRGRMQFRGREYLVVGVGHDGHTTLIPHTQSTS